MRGLAGVLAPSADAVVLPEEPRAASVRTAAVIGLVAGVASFAAYDVLPAPWDRLGDSAGLWCLLTWWLGQRVRPLSVVWAALVGSVSQVCLLVGFYGALLVLAGRGDDPWRVLLWLGLALLAGPAFGVLGTLRWCRGWLGTASAALVGVAVVLEPVLAVVPALVGTLRPPQAFVEYGSPPDEDLVWCAAAAAFGLLAAAVGAPRGRRAASVAVAVAVVTAVSAVVALRAAAVYQLL